MIHDAVPTKRPHPSQPDDDTLTGQLMAAVARVEATAERLERAAASMRHEHETNARTVVALHRRVDEMMDAHAATDRAITVAKRATPALIVAFEVLRAVMQHFGVLK